MQRQPEKRVWFVECAGLWRPARPAHAFELIREEDRRQQRDKVICPRVRVFANFDALYSETEEAFDGAELYRAFDFTAATVAAWARLARNLSVTHVTKDMRVLYGRCAVHLDFEAQRLARPACETPTYVGTSLDD
jgi:hypothetical protein